MSKKLSREMEFIVQDTMVNYYGFLHGGELFKNMDTVAGLCTRYYSGHPTVTKAVNNFTFKTPSYVGDKLTIYSHIDYVGTTSMEVYVKTYNHTKGRTAASGYFTMVAVDEDKRPVPVPKPVLKTEEDFKYHELGKKRREIYKQIEALD